MNEDRLTEKLNELRARADRAALAAGRDPASVALLAATKTQDDDTIRAAIRAGVTLCGENRVQELTGHLERGVYDHVPVHFIGHLQTNKVKYVVGRVELIHSISSEKLLRCVSAQAEKIGVVQDILLEVNLAGEESKSGFAPDETLSAAQLAASLAGVRPRGLMCIPPPAEGEKNRRFFSELRKLAVDISQKMGDNRLDFSCLSMGMSGDFEDAIAEGAAIIRLGTALFGPRPAMRAEP